MPSSSTDAVAPAQPAVFVTGASTGLGAAITRRFLAEGWAVWGTSRRADRAAEAFADASAFHAVELDLADAEAAVEAYRQAAAAAPNGFAVVVNNAGYGAFGEFASSPPSLWADQLNGMVTSTALLAQAQLSDLLERGRGTLVNVASLATEFPLPYMAGYNMAKAALSALSESLLIETAPTPISVIDFRPGDYRTGFNQSMQTTQPASALPARLAGAWQALEHNINTAPPAEQAARDLWQAVQSGKQGTIRSGSVFQTVIAPLFQRVVPTSWARAVRWRYLGIR